MCPAGSQGMQLVAFHKSTWQRVDTMIWDGLEPRTNQRPPQGQRICPVSVRNGSTRHIYANKRSGRHTSQPPTLSENASQTPWFNSSVAGKSLGGSALRNAHNIVETRSRIGDWEADTVIGRQGGAVLVTLAERKSRFSLIIKAENKTATAVSNAISKAMGPHAANVHTLTYDNGKEFAYHQQVSDVLDAKGFFAHPYHSWERGLNENTNGLIRQYLPKGKSFDDLTDQEVEHIMDRLNNRPRKCLGFRTPNQVFFEAKSDVALAS